MATILRDALRGLRAGKGTTLLSFTIFAVAITAGTVTFSVVDAVALRRLPFEDASRLVAIPKIETARAARLGPAAPQDYFAWKDEVNALQSLGMYRNNVILPMQSVGTSQRLSVARVTTNFFDVLRVKPALGRLFGSEHDIAGNDGVIVLSHALWVRAFGADRDVIGHSLTLSPDTREIIGVLPPDITYPIGLEMPTDAYIPSIATAAEHSDASPGRTFNAYIVGRLRPHATIAQAQQEIDALNRARARGTSASAASTHTVRPLLDYIVGEAGPWLLLVLGGVGSLLLVACVNVANLFLVRATVRTRELATREALGASRHQIIATLVAEGLILSLMAGLAGIVSSYWTLNLVKSTLPKGLARASTIALDGKVLSISIVVVVLCGLAFASAPAWLASRIDLFTATRTGSGAVIGGHRRKRSLAAFLIGETAFVTALLVATVLIVTSFILITTADLGFDRRNVMAFSVQKTMGTMPESDRGVAAATLRADLLRRVRAVPGVVNAAFIRNGVPLGGGAQYSIRLPGDSGPMNGRMFEVREVTSDYFSTLDIRLVRGRGIEPSDGAGAPPVAVIDETAAHRFFADRDPIGQVLTFRAPVTVVGVIHSVRLYGPEVDSQPQLYVALEQSADARGDVDGDLVVRTTGPAARSAPLIRESVTAALADGEIFQPRFVDEAFSRLTASRRFNAQLMTIFGIVALVVGAIGIYGTMAFVVAQETRTIGLRLALGATPERIRRSVLTEAIRRVATGVAIGLGTAWALSGLFSSLVFGVRPTQPAVLVGVAVLMGFVALVAAWMPARRASRLDPIVALRTD